MTTPFINWAGSREKDMRVISPLIPKDIGTFVDPFVGDGACFHCAGAGHYVLADKNQDLMDCWRTVQTGGPRFRGLLSELGYVWHRADEAFGKIRDSLLDVKSGVDEGLYAEYMSKVAAVKRVVDKVTYDEVFTTPFGEPKEFKIELHHQLVSALEKMTASTEEDTAELSFYTAFKAAVYMNLVEVYNRPESKNALRAALLIFLMEYAKGDKFVADREQFRPEYAGRLANTRSSLVREVAATSEDLAAKLERTRFFCQDLFRSLGFPFAKAEDSFLFLDVPVASKNGLIKNSRKRLAEFLLAGTLARWMVICPPEDVIAAILEESGAVKNSVALGKERIYMNY